MVGDATSDDPWHMLCTPPPIGVVGEGTWSDVSGRRIVHLLGKHADNTDGDVAHMSKVVGYVRRHLAQRPDGDAPWRHSLMIWGHDPLNWSGVQGRRCRVEEAPLHPNAGGL